MPDEIFNFLLCLTKVQCYYRRINTFWSIFAGFGHTKILDAIFLGQSVLLNSTIFNDMYE